MVKHNPIFDEAEREINDITMKCNSCDELDNKIKKIEKDFDVKTKGAFQIKNEEVKNKTLNNLTDEYTKQLNRLKKIKERNCHDD